MYVELDLQDPIFGVPEFKRQKLRPKSKKNKIYGIYFFRAGGTAEPVPKVIFKLDFGW